MQPDNPALCTFYLEGLLAGLKDASPAQVLTVVHCLTAFLWRFTFVAVPEFLRIPLLVALHGTGARMCAMAQPGTITAVLAVAIDECTVTAILLDKDDTYLTWVAQRPNEVDRILAQSRVWRRHGARNLGEGNEEALQFGRDSRVRYAGCCVMYLSECSCCKVCDQILERRGCRIRRGAQRGKIQHLNSCQRCAYVQLRLLGLNEIACRRHIERNLYFSGYMRKIIAIPDKGLSDIHSEAAKVLLTAIPRGVGLARSAYGALAEPRAVEAVMKRMSAAAAGSGLETMRKHCMFLRSIGAFTNTCLGLQPTRCRARASARLHLYEARCRPGSASVIGSPCKPAGPHRAAHARCARSARSCRYSRVRKHDRLRRAPRRRVCACIF